MFIYEGPGGLEKPWPSHGTRAEVREPLQAPVSLPALARHLCTGLTTQRLCAWPNVEMPEAGKLHSRWSLLPRGP